MPLASHVGTVTGSAEKLRPGSSCIDLICEGTPIARGTPDGGPGIKHGTASNTNSARPGTHIIGVGEGRSHVHESVDMGGVNIEHIHCADRLVAVVVCKNEKDIRLLRLRRGTAK